MKWRKHFSNCGHIQWKEDSQQHGVEDNVIFLFDQLPRLLSAGREKVDDKSQQWNPWKQSGRSLENGKGPYHQFLYDENDSTSNVSLERWVNERWSRSSNDKKTQKKQTQRRPRRHLLCVDAIAFDAEYSPFFGVVMEIWKNAAASIQTWRSVPGPLAQVVWRWNTSCSTFLERAQAQWSLTLTHAFTKNASAWLSAAILQPRQRLYGRHFLPWWKWTWFIDQKAFLELVFEKKKRNGHN